MQILYVFKFIFGNKGNILKKSGSENVFVYSLKGTQNLLNFVLPFFYIFVVPFSSKYKIEVYQRFVEILNILNNNKNKTMQTDDMIKLIKLVYLLNPDSKGKSRKRTLEETLDIVRSNSVRIISKEEKNKNIKVINLKRKYKKMYNPQRLQAKDLFASICNIS